MAKRALVGQVVRCNDKLSEVVAIGEGRMVLMREIGASSCPRCERPYDHWMLEGSPQFEDSVKPVETLNVA